MTDGPAPPRVAMLLFNPFTHDSRVEREAAALGRVGMDVTVLALAAPGLPEHEERAGYRVRRLDLRSRSWRGRLLAPAVHFAAFLRAVLRALRDLPTPDVVHAHDANTLYAGLRAARTTGARLLYDAHELERDRNFGARRLSGIYRHLTVLPEVRCIRRADAVITASPGYARELAAAYGIAEPVVVRNCPDWADPETVESAPDLRGSLGLDAGARIAVTAGGVLLGRGIASFLDAVERTDGVHGVVLGDGPLVEPLRAEARAGRWSRAHFVPAVPPSRLQGVLRAADVAVGLIEDTCRSYRLCLPNKLFEGIQAGLPVIVSDLPEMRRIVDGDGLGAVVDPNDTERVAAAIQRLASAGPERDRVLAANRAARDAHLWSVEERRLLAVYATLTA